MTDVFTTPWHRDSFDELMNNHLPRLISRRLPMAGYACEPRGEEECQISVVLGNAGCEVSLAFDNIPRPTEDGIVRVGGRRVAVIPIAQSEDLEAAEIRCIGEQLYWFVEARLGSAPADLPWDTTLAAALLPLDSWVRTFFEQVGRDLEATNWLSLRTQLRRLNIPNRQRVSTREQTGRTCPIETPEGPNVGRVLTIARGATICEGVLNIEDSRAEMGLGLSASMIPFLEHDEPVRAVMGANMMRQWLTPPDPEPALVRTGLEPEVPEFWCGRNLLTAFMTHGAETFEDAIVISESCARRFAYPKPIEPGDKLSNRHGAKGVVSRIVPDDEMPHTADGQPVEIVYDSMGIYSRINLGQVRELLLGRIAVAEGAPALAPPFAAPTQQELRARLAANGLAADGMEQLTDGRSGPMHTHRAAVGTVYWGRLSHLASDKLHTAIGPTCCQSQGELEFYALKNAGAVANLDEQFNTRAQRRTDAATLADRAAAGPIVAGGPLSPQYLALARRLDAAGIRATLEGDRILFSLQTPSRDSVALAARIGHPWLPGEYIDRIGALPEVPELRAVLDANARIERLVANSAPESLRTRAVRELSERLRDYLSALAAPAHVKFAARTLFSARAVCIPSDRLRHDQVGIPDEIAWTLFGPLVARELGDSAPVRRRSKEAEQILDQVMAKRWMLINRPPSLEPVSFLAYKAIRTPGNVILLHSMASDLLNADFDGDVLSLFLPLTDAAQHEAGERLTLAGHLKRDPALLSMIRPLQGAWAGLVMLSHTAVGRAEILAVAGDGPSLPDAPITRETYLNWMHARLEALGEEKAVETIARLTTLGFATSRRAGLSISPFVGSAIDHPPLPSTDNPAAWAFHAEQFGELLLSHKYLASDDLASDNVASDNVASDDLGDPLFAVRSGSRGTMSLLVKLTGFYGPVTDADGRGFAIRNSLAVGLTATELCAAAAMGRGLIAVQAGEISSATQNARASYGPTGMHVLARAMRARNPGLVFARAAASEEIDPLLDSHSRLFIGLDPIAYADNLSANLTRR